MRLVKDNPELYEELGHDAFFDLYAAAADDERKRRREAPDARMQREEHEADVLQDRWPGRWPSWASPARMRKDLQREREEDR